MTSSDFYLDSLRPYTRAYENLQRMLFWRRPLPMLLLILVLELFSAFVRLGDLGLLSVISVLIAAFYIVQQFYRLFGISISETLFPPIDETVYPLPSFCQCLASITSVFDTKFSQIRSSLQTSPVPTLAAATFGFLGLSLLFAVTGTFWFLYVVGHLLVLAPGILLNPKVYVYIEPYIVKLAEAIGFPNEHPKTD
jgi:hypothetical protein